MLTGLRRMLVALIAVAGSLALWQWLVRMLRPPAPQSDGLLRRMPDTLLTWRIDDRLHVEWDFPQRGTQVSITPVASTTAEQTTHTNTNRATFSNIDLQTVYQVQVHFPDGRQLASQERELPFPNVPNFRDIGGYPTRDGRHVRWQQLYRSSAFDRSNDDDHAILRDLGIQLVCDVRTAAEAQASPNLLPDGINHLSAAPHSNDNRWLEVGKLLYVPGHLERLLLDLYTRVMIDENPQVFRAIFRRLTEEASYPAVIHCAIGKDRTGITVALLLRVLGVPDETIIADYTLSNRHYDFFRQTTRKVMGQLQIIGIDERDFDYLLVADGHIMRQTLAHIDDTYGSAEAYLTQYVGLTSDDLNAIREHLLD